jgi:uncharacterized protein (DUF433 family)
MLIHIRHAVAYNSSGVTAVQLEATQNVPLTQWEDGTIRISGTRVTLDAIVKQFKLGATAEQIHDSFPAASLKDIYGIIYYYLQHTEAVEVYIQEQRQAAAATHQWVESQPENRVLRERLLARQPLVRD